MTRGVAPLFPFGFGLSYTSFAYDDLVVSPATVAMDDELAVRFRLTNTGDRDGAEIAQVYARAQGSACVAAARTQGLCPRALAQGRSAGRGTARAGA
jgi:beta-glucosidase